MRAAAEIDVRQLARSLLPRVILTSKLRDEDEDDDDAN